MGLYFTDEELKDREDSLEHGLFGSSRKNHKYIDRKWKNGRWVYTYRDKAYKDTSKMHYAEGKTAEEAFDTAYNNHKELYDKYSDPNYRNADGSDGKNFANYELQEMSRIAKDKRKYKESNPSVKSSLGKLLLKFKINENVLKTKIKDIIDG